MNTVGFKLATSLVSGALVVLLAGATLAQGVSLSPAQIDILPPIPTEVDDIFVRLRGMWSDACGPRPPVTKDVVGGVINLTTSSSAQACAQVITSYDVPVQIGHLDGGSYRVAFIHCTPSFGCQRLGERIFVVACPFPSREVRRPDDINCGPDLGGTGHTALNFTGSAGSGGDTWLTVFDQTPNTRDQTILTSSVSVSADILIHRFNNKKGAGLLALFNEGAGQNGLVLIVYDAGNTDSLVLATVDDAGKLTTLKSVALHAGIRENAWYRLTMEVVVSGDDLSVTGRAIRHDEPDDPKSALGTPVGGTLSTPKPLSLTALGLQGSGEVGIVASAISGVVDSSVTHFEVNQD